MRQRAKANIALGLAAFLAAGAIVAICTMCAMTDRATNFDPDPQQILQTQETAADEESPFKAIDWDYWQDVNPDVIGWITVPGTGIDYPLVQASASDPTYYLSHDVYCDYNYHGAPYLSYRCAEGGLLRSPNALVFGHHLLDGTMFSELSDFIDADYVAEHSPIIIQTPEANATLTVLAVDRVNAWAETATLDFDEAATYREWLADTVSNADLTLATPDDLKDMTSVVTLCTCSYSTWSNERTLIYCSVDLEEVS